MSHSAGSVRGPPSTAKHVLTTLRSDCCSARRVDSQAIEEEYKGRQQGQRSECDVGDEASGERACQGDREEHEDEEKPPPLVLLTSERQAQDGCSQEDEQANLSDGATNDH